MPIGAANVIARTQTRGDLVRYWAQGGPNASYRVGVSKSTDGLAFSSKVFSDNTPTVGFRPTWSLGAAFMSVGRQGTPYLHMYTRVGDTFTKIASLGTTPTGSVYDTGWTWETTTCAAVHDTTPFVTIYNRSGTTFTKVSNPGTLPSNSGQGSHFTPGSDYLAISSVASPYILVYNRSGDTYTKVSNPGTLPTARCGALRWDTTGTTLAVPCWSTPFIILYNRSGDTLTKVADPSTIPPSGNTRTDVVSWSPDGKFVAVGFNASPYFYVYRRNGDTYTKLTDPSTVGIGNIADLAWSQDSTKLYTHSGSTTLRLYDVTESSLTYNSNWTIVSNIVTYQAGLATVQL